MYCIVGMISDRATKRRQHAFAGRLKDLPSAMTLFAQSEAHSSLALIQTDVLRLEYSTIEE